MLTVLLQRPRNRVRAWLLRRAARRSFAARAIATPAASERPVAACRLCAASSRGQHVLGAAPLTGAAHLQDRRYRLILCTGCDVVYLDPLPTPADLKALYEDASQFTSAEYADAASVRRTVNSYARRIDWLRLLPGAGEGCLEVGAGLAWVSRVCKARNPAVRTVAQDVSAECARVCPWVDDYFVGRMDDLPRNTPFRLISLTHVIEHLPEPARMLDAVASRLCRGGHVYITAPFRPPLWRREEGLAPWLAYGYLHVPAHISYLSRRWLMRAAAQSGLELMHWDDSHDGHQVFEAVLRKI